MANGHGARAAGITVAVSVLSGVVIIALGGAQPYAASTDDQPQAAYSAPPAAPTPKPSYTCPDDSRVDDVIWCIGRTSTRSPAAPPPRATYSPRYTPDPDSAPPVVSSVPAGGGSLCGDGTFSGASGQGACSWHKGVVKPPKVPKLPKAPPLKLPKAPPHIKVPKLR
ncbi:hypothetical protein GCM10010289_38400 [Streptomyces violascens]|uniref:DUF3761 domain-containing protein n=1 Tax=Streptomyces violascens TaxID=67381 RepID=A0ABQ3QXA9_9ACTN|nr:hypothetical protein GCM10010289_38400 [Streptomyces violascens]GHI41890.1 hypothetical protein Sviol_62980 [Streptomyces violascens]